MKVMNGLVTTLEEDEINFMFFLVSGRKERRVAHQSSSLFKSRYRKRSLFV